MKHTFILLISALLFCYPVDAQERVIDNTRNIVIASLILTTGIDGAISSANRIMKIK